jgi:hypothetical protein
VNVLAAVQNADHQAVLIHAQPSAAGAQIAPCHDARNADDLGRRRGRAVEMLVAICREQ